MTSLFPGAMTKQILVTPAVTMRSSRYSLTARGLSVSPLRRLPTGSSSLEKASGCMRLPMPAAGTIPHMSCTPDDDCLRDPHRSRPGSRAVRFDQLDELARAIVRRVLGKGARTRRFTDAGKLGSRPRQRAHDVVDGSCDDDFAARFVESVEAF